jgi:hypothetical protein
MIRFKDGWRILERKTAKRVLRQEPYDPDAKDGDGDGIVQEGTPWERPFGTRFVRANGRPIATGLQTADRPSSAKLVDRDGNPVEYTPTYDRPGYKPLGTTIGEQVGNVAEVVKKPKERKRIAGDPITAKLKGATEWFEGTYLDKIRGWLDSQDRSWQKVKGLRVFDPNGLAGADERIDIDREGEGFFTQEKAKMFAAHLVAKRMREKGVDFSKVYPSWEPIIDFKSGEVTLIQVSAERDELSVWRNPTKDWVRIDRRDPRYEELRSEGIASALIQKWARMDDADLQLAAGRLLGDVDSAGMYRPVRNREFEDNAELFDAMIETMHEEAQKMLSDMGIDQMRLYRGMSVISRDETGKKVREAVAEAISSMPIAELKEWFEDEGVGFPDIFMDDVPIQLNPISSFSTYYPMAKQFAQGAEEGDARLVISGSVPASRIVGIPGTGIGCFEESEFVVLTGDSNRFGVEVYPSPDFVEEIAREKGIWEQMFPEEEEEE